MHMQMYTWYRPCKKNTHKNVNIATETVVIGQGVSWTWPSTDPCGTPSFVFNIGTKKQPINLKQWLPNEWSKTLNPFKGRHEFICDVPSLPVHQSHFSIRLFLFCFRGTSGVRSALMWTTQQRRKLTQRKRRPHFVAGLPLVSLLHGFHGGSDRVPILLSPVGVVWWMWKWDGWVECRRGICLLISTVGQSQVKQSHSTTGAKHVDVICFSALELSRLFICQRCFSQLSRRPHYNQGSPSGLKGGRVSTITSFQTWEVASLLLLFLFL